MKYFFNIKLIILFKLGDKAINKFRSVLLEIDIFCRKAGTFHT